MHIIIVLHTKQHAWLENFEDAGPYVHTLLFHKGPLLASTPYNEDMIGPTCLMSINYYKNFVNILMLSFLKKRETMKNDLFFY